MTVQFNEVIVCHPRNIVNNYLVRLTILIRNNALVVRFVDIINVVCDQQMSVMKLLKAGER